MEKIKAESLEHARQQIDAIDTALVELIAARQFYVDQTTRFKKPKPICSHQNVWNRL